MTDPALRSRFSAARAPRASPSGQVAWFRSRLGRRYGRELCFVILAKLVLLVVLWLVFIKPWPSPVVSSASIAEQLYTTSPAARRD
jgi:hypothetical protein